MMSSLALGLVIAGIVIFAGFLVIISAAQSVIHRGRRELPRVSDVAIVLGAYTDGFRPGPALTARLRSGLNLYQQGIVRCMIVCGGRGEDETVTEASAMKRFLVLNGVPPDVIFEERKSTDTWENLRNGKTVMEKHHLSSAVIVTSDYHLPRAMAVAKRLSMDVSGFAATSRKAELRYAVREVFALLKYAASGQVPVP